MQTIQLDDGDYRLGTLRIINVYYFPQTRIHINNPRYLDQFFYFNWIKNIHRFMQKKRLVVLKFINLISQFNSPPFHVISHRIAQSSKLKQKIEILYQNLLLNPDGAAIRAFFNFWNPVQFVEIPISIL
ncbi:MAG: hypothetical protein LBU84_11810 [Prevotella sp.]|jgi:hypothetical protein|nr:hypothetical protein [Prevotella sp.]